MKPAVMKKLCLLKKARYRFREYKEMRKMLRNKKRPVTDQAIALT